MARELPRTGAGNDFAVGQVVDVCIGQQGQDLAVPGSCERELQIEGDFVPPPEEG
jgi:hypothetical protein